MLMSLQRGNARELIIEPGYTFNASFLLTKLGSFGFWKRKSPDSKDHTGHRNHRNYACTQDTSCLLKLIFGNLLNYRNAEGLLPLLCEYTAITIRRLSQYKDNWKVRYALPKCHHRGLQSDQTEKSLQVCLISFPERISVPVCWVMIVL